MKEYVVLVDPKDEILGTMEKMEAHEKALLHRAISVFIINTDGKWLLQRRALHKYHSPGLWTNSTCTHPRIDEFYEDAAHRRLMEEIGLKSEIEPLFKFIYKEEFDNDLTEHELDQVFIGVTDAVPQLNAEEVMDYKYVDFDELHADVQRNPEQYTVWFRKIYERVHQESLIRAKRA